LFMVQFAWFNAMHGLMHGLISWFTSFKGNAFDSQNHNLKRFDH